MKLTESLNIEHSKAFPMLNTKFAGSNDNVCWHFFVCGFVGERRKLVHHIILPRYVHSPPSQTMHGRVHGLAGWEQCVAFMNLQQFRALDLKSLSTQRPAFELFL